MENKGRIASIMTKNVITIDPRADLNTVAKLLKKNKIRHIPVVEHDKIVGILSLTDLSRMSFVDSYGDDESVDSSIYDMLTVSQIMVSNPVKVASDANIKDVALLLASKEFHALPVVDNDKLVGIITTTDLLKYLVQLY